MSTTTVNKRQRELRREERKREKSARRDERKREKMSKSGASNPGEDPDIAGVVPGPQPPPEW
jgi:hypothetical protein